MIDVPADVSKRADFVIYFVHLGAIFAHQRAIEKDIFGTRQFWMKANAELKQRRYRPTHNKRPTIWFENSANDFEQGAFSCAISTDECNPFAAINFERDIRENNLARYPNEWLTTETTAQVAPE